MEVCGKSLCIKSAFMDIQCLVVDERLFVGLLVGFFGYYTEW